jgi:hypothetical protein
VPTANPYPEETMLDIGRATRLTHDNPATYELPNCEAILLVWQGGTTRISNCFSGTNTILLSLVPILFRALVPPDLVNRSSKGTRWNRSKESGVFCTDVAWYLSRPWNTRHRPPKQPEVGPKHALEGLPQPVTNVLPCHACTKAARPSGASRRVPFELRFPKSGGTQAPEGMGTRLILLARQRKEHGPVSAMRSSGLGPLRSSNRFFAKNLSPLANLFTLTAGLSTSLRMQTFIR